MKESPQDMRTDAIKMITTLLLGPIQMKYTLFGPAIAFGGSYVTSSVCPSVCLSATQDLILPTIRFF